MKKTLIIFSTLLLQTGNAHGQQAALDVCRSLANSGLVDSSSASSMSSVYSSEVDLFCSEQSTYQTNFSAKSSAFRASFSDVARKFGIGGGSQRSNGFSDTQFRKICDDHFSELASTYAASSQRSVGRVLAQNVRRCVESVAGSQQDVTYGTAQLQYDGSSVLATISRRAPISAAKLKFAGMNPKADFGTCTSGDINASGLTLSNELTVSCPVLKKNGAFPNALKGAFVFRAETGQASSLDFDLAKQGFEERIIKENVTRLDKEVARLSSVVSNGFRQSVVAFLSDNKCPDGWRRYKAADGMFLRGIDPEGRIDQERPDDKARTAGHIQTSLVGNHTHNVPVRYPGPGKASFGLIWNDPSSPPESSHIASSGGVETRPVNLSVLFCTPNS